MNHSPSARRSWTFSTVSACTLFLVLLACFVGSLSPAHAVDVTGRIRGSVTDPTGAVVPNVQVVATNQATGVKYTTSSNATGDYIFQQLPVGTYTISAAFSGFKSFSASGIVLNIDQEYVEPVKLQSGATTETVEVEADPVQVNTTDMQLNNIVTSAQMVELPLIDRGFTELETIEPGVQSSSDRFGSYSADGAQTQQSSYLINGADTNDIALNNVTFSPNLDAIEQFNLVTGPLNAQYDRNSGGIVNATLKQGTNHFHGDIFEFYRDTFLNTPNFFDYIPATSTAAAYKFTPPFHQNIYGGTIGGPILKDKLFFFFAYQGTHERAPGTDGGGNAEVYSSAQLLGNFSDDLNPKGGNLGYTFSSNPIPGTVNIPGCPAGTAWSACATKYNGIFPASSFNPLATKLISTYVPAPNSGTNGYNYAATETETDNQYIGRMDYSFNSKNQIYAIVINDKEGDVQNIPFTGANIPGFGEIDGSTIWQYTADYVHQFGATAVNELALHYTRFNFQAVLPQNIVQPSSLGFSITPENAAAASVPTMNIGGQLVLGFSTNGPQPRIDQVPQIDDNFSKSLGHHTLKFGYDGRRYNVSNPFGADNSGSYDYSASSSLGSGDPYLDFLYGAPTSYAQGSGSEIQAKAYLNYLYGQDTWKLADNFTLDYGIGYQIDTPLHNLQYGGEAIICFIPGQQSKVFSTAPVDINYPGDPGCSNSAQARTHYTEFGPRLGFAYSPDLGALSAGNSHKLSIRGGFGIYYNRTEEETSLNNLQAPPFGLRSSGAQDYGALAPGFANPYTDLNTGTAYANKFPYAFPTPGATPNYGLYEFMELNTYDKNFRSPYAENFQLSVERELPSKTILRLTYVGSLAHHNQITYEGSPETAAGHAACLANPVCAVSAAPAQGYYFPGNTQYNAVDPNTGEVAFTTIGTVTSEGSSNYNSGQVSVEKGLSHGLQFQLSYTYAHAMDNGSNYENSGYGGSTRGYNQFNTALNYGDSTYDARNRLVFAPIYVVPFKTGGSTFSPINLALSGWQISGITTLAQGFPYDISYGGGSANSLWCSPETTFYACPDEPNQTGPLVRQNPRARIANFNTEWFAPTNLAQASLGQFGNEHRDAFHGPGVNNTNLILAKNFALSADGTRRLQIRLESDNVFNHTQFSNPDSTVSSTTTAANGASESVNNPGVLSVGAAGQISSAANGRQTQLAAKIYF